MAKRWRKATRLETVNGVGYRVDYETTGQLNESGGAETRNEVRTPINPPGSTTVRSEPSRPSSRQAAAAAAGGVEEEQAGFDHSQGVIEADDEERASPEEQTTEGERAAALLAWEQQIYQNSQRTVESSDGSRPSPERQTQVSASQEAGADKFVDTIDSYDDTVERTEPSRPSVEEMTNAQYRDHQRQRELDNRRDRLLEEDRLSAEAATQEGRLIEELRTQRGEDAYNLPNVIDDESKGTTERDASNPFGKTASWRDRDRAMGRDFFPGDKEVDLVSDEQSEFTVKTKEKGTTSPADATDPKTVAKKKAEEANAKAKAESEAAAKRNANRQARPYIPTYYSGTQAQIYFHDVLVDEINYFQYNVITNRAPIYGYASELFDAVARGNKIIQGSFSINFIEANYIPIIAASLTDYSINVNRRTSKHYNFGGDPTLAHDIEYDTLEFNSELHPDSYLGKQVVNQVQSLGNKEFREISRQMNINKFQRDGSFTNIKGTALNQFENIGPFDIYMVFGDYTDSEADHTVRCIKDVFLVGQGQTVVADGSPVAENYVFIGREIL